MEFKSINSKLKLEENKLIVEIENMFFKSKPKKYVTLNYDVIKSVFTSSYKPVTYIIYFCGIVLGLSFFVTTHEVLLDGRYYIVPVEMYSRLLCVLLGLIIIFLGYRFNKKYGDYNTLSVRYFEGQIKVSHIFTSESKDELYTIQKEIESRIK